MVLEFTDEYTAPEMRSIQGRNDGTVIGESGYDVDNMPNSSCLEKKNGVPGAGSRTEITLTGGQLGGKFG